jgi:hypothetical protein
MKNLPLAAAFTFNILLVFPSSAATTTIGPFIDLQTDLPAPDAQVIGGSFSTFFKANVVTFGPPGYIVKTPVQFCSPTPQGFFCRRAGISDLVAWSSGMGPYTPARLLGVAYISSEEDSSGIPSDSLRITTIYGLENSGSGSLLSMTGFTASNRELTFNSETIFGKSGTLYVDSTPEISPISALGNLLGSSFDLSIFQGSPNSEVYVFSTIVPASDIATIPIPEPDARGILGLTGLGMVGSLFRRLARLSEEKRKDKDG